MISRPYKFRIRPVIIVRVIIINLIIPPWGIKETVSVIRISEKTGREVAPIIIIVVSVFIIRLSFARFGLRFAEFGVASR